jgi:glycosyltransferase involved in cell wall biosynthesis
MNILFISTWFPYPPDNGSKTRVYYLLRALAERHQIHLLTFMPTAEEARFIPVLQAYCPQVDVVQRDPFWRDWRKALLGYLSPWPRDVVSGYSPGMARLVSVAAWGQQYGVVIASQVSVAPYALSVNGVPRFVEIDNYMGRLLEEQYRAQHNPARRILRWLTWQKCRRYERWLYPQFDACTLVSEQDRQALLATVPGCSGRVAVIPNGVDVERHYPGLAEPQPNTLVFNGALTYYANADAMRFFLTEIMPLIRAQCPDVRLQITGRTAGVDLSGLPLDGRVTLTGYLDDVRPTVAGSWACVVPLRIGGGSRLKILEAMALGTPVVTTSKGAEGLAVTPEHDVLIADEPARFALQTLRLLRDPDLRERLAKNGRLLVEAKYGWEQISRQFCEVIQFLVDAQDKRPRCAEV